MQLNFDVVPTASDINVDKLSGQNGKLLQYLLDGNRINCMHPAMNTLGIGYLNSRIADLRRFLQDSHLHVASRMIKVGDTDVKEYWIEPNSLNQ